MAVRMPSTRVESAGTGTPSDALPRAPSTSTRTFQDPAAINQSVPVKYCGSCFDGRARSGTGANCGAAVRRKGTMWIWLTSLARLRISIPATPGITCGGRIVTSSL